MPAAIISKDINIVIFGATGVTGKYVIREIEKAAKENEKLSWAVAGREEAKLIQALVECGCDVGRVPTIVANIKDEESIENMCKRANVILNTVGPFQLWGETVVKACIKYGTHHIDVSGEPLFLENMQLKYHSAAEEAGVYIVGACGFDSIPADMGVEYMKQNFEGELNSVETFLSVKVGPNGINVGLGTWNSLINGVSNATKLKGMRTALCAKIFPEQAAKSSYKLKPRGILFNSDIAKGWCTIFPGSDRSVIIRSQMANYQLYMTKPVQVQTYVRFPGLIYALLTAFMGVIFGLFSTNRCGRYLLKNYPGIFSLGLFRKEGPTEEQVKDSKMKITFYGQGWAEKLGPNEEHSNSPNKIMTMSMIGPDPGYGFTSMAMVSAGLVALQESDKMPSSGGVYTSATAFGKTSLFDKLKKGGLSFDIQ